jgi:hypothetical protein
MLGVCAEDGAKLSGIGLGAVAPVRGAHSRALECILERRAGVELHDKRDPQLVDAEQRLGGANVFQELEHGRVCQQIQRGELWPQSLCYC